MSALINKTVWVVDDDYPLERIVDVPEAVLTGDHPMDSSLLRQLVALGDEQWDHATELREATGRLATSGAEILAFRNPQAMLAYLQKGVRVPDAIVFDMKYERLRRLPSPEVLECLGLILGQFYVLVQIFTNESEAQVTRELEPLKQKFGDRIPSPVLKVNVDPAQLVNGLETLFQTSVSAHLGPAVRTTTSLAIESALVNLSRLPFQSAIRELIAQDDEDSAAASRDLTELISSKLIEALHADPSFNKALVTAWKEGSLQNNSALIPGIVAQIRNRFFCSTTLTRALERICELVRGAPKPAPGVAKIDPESISALRQFHSFRLYDRFACDIVQTGDIVDLKLQNIAQTQGELALIVTPICDLTRFWSKTAGILAFIRLHQFEIGAKLLKDNGADFKISNSITASDPFVLPSVPLSAGLQDYLLFPRQTCSVQLSRLDGEQKKIPLTYKRLTDDGAVERAEPVARISEPFLSGILLKIPDVLIRAGLPDFSEQEKTRMKEEIAA